MGAHFVLKPGWCSFASVSLLKLVTVNILIEQALHGFDRECWLKSISFSQCDSSAADLFGARLLKDSVFGKT